MILPPAFVKIDEPIPYTEKRENFTGFDVRPQIDWKQKEVRKGESHRHCDVQTRSGGGLSAIWVGCPGTKLCRPSPSEKVQLSPNPAERTPA